MDKTENKTHKKLKLTFAGGVDTVTGANFLLETIPEEGENPIRILVDCGLEQGGGEAFKNNFKPFIYDPKTIDYLFVTHAHIDHIGRVPHLVREGFRGKIFSTTETKKLAPIMLEDSMKLLTQGVESKDEMELYNEKDIQDTMGLWHEIPYDTCTDLQGGFQVCARDAGHILGSVMYEFTYNGSNIVFTGDLGNSPTPLLRDTEPIFDARYIVMESVYGDRNHEGGEERRDRLENVIEESYKRKGTLVIPCFSLEKTQVLLHEIKTLLEQGRIPYIPVFLDSPLAIKVTDIYKEKSRGFNSEIKKEMMNDEDIFNFPKLIRVGSVEESKKIFETPDPKIIIAGSGMSNGGRVVHHEAHYLPDPKNTVLFVGYQALGTLGRKLQNGDTHVKIFGSMIPVRAHIETISGYSSHKDSEHLLEFVANTRDTLEKVFVVMGEPKSSLYLVQKIQDNLAVEAENPKQNQSVILDF